MSDQSPDPRLHDGVGCWVERLTAELPPGRPALFLDRDGVVVEEAHYLSDPAKVRVLDGVAPAIARCNALGLPVVLVTNQAGIARGYYGWREFEAVQRAMIGRLAAAGARIDLVLACAFHDVGTAPYRVAEHPWRKPNPGMILAAAEMLAIDLPASAVIGDKVSDLAAGAAAGLARAVLVRTGHGRDEEAKLGRLPGSGRTAFTVAADMPSALDALVASGWPDGAGRAG
ncbi:D-glycero-alpha-D-manno-heptose-1,7-bisphosphate 7-phosphatase [Rhodoplanes azumiensis]|uniref:D,D-heptose 1,7-bisphosphate phosphatase n=1 Tax=Rhodoplanes azumiensis TaxID=1897628 RepID=A0ABW5AHH3_9BRAD